MIIASEQELISYGQKIGSEISTPAVIELVGDVGAGKTTLTRGIAQGMGIKSPITSPSFTISKRYAFCTKNGAINYLTHYDFYRLPDPGIMSEDLSESISDQNTVTIVEWGDSVKDLLPENRRTIRLSINKDGTRSLEEK